MTVVWAIGETDGFGNWEHAYSGQIVINLIQRTMPNPSTIGTVETTQPTTEVHTTEIQTSEPTTEESTIGPTTEESTIEPTTEESTIEPTTEEQTSQTRVTTTGHTNPEITSTEDATEYNASATPFFHSANILVMICSIAILCH